MKAIHSCACVLLLLLASESVARTFTFQEENSLSGITELVFDAFVFDLDSLPSSVSEESVETRAFLRLLNMGIDVSLRQKDLPDEAPEPPYTFIILIILKYDSELSAYDIRSEYIFVEKV